MSRHLNFLKFAEERMTRIFTTMNLVANLSTVAKYNYTRYEVEEFFSFYFQTGDRVRILFLKEGYEKIKNEELIFTYSTLPIVGDLKNLKFREISELRLNKVSENLRLISNLSNKKNYTYTEEEIDTLFSAFLEKGEEIKRFFEPYLDPLVEKFVFKER